MQVMDTISLSLCLTIHKRRLDSTFYERSKSDQTEGDLAGMNEVEFSAVLGDRLSQITTKEIARVVRGKIPLHYTF